MQKSDIHILIVEDDKTLGKSLFEAFKRDGFQAKLVTNADEALSSIKITEYQVAIVDCMIPKMNGVELGALLRKEMGDELLLMLTSGIYKDKQFTREALTRTKAQSFFTKPFNLEDIIETITEHFASHLDEAKDPILNLLSKSHPSNSEKVTAINDAEFIHGFHLPFIYSVLSSSHLSGELSLTDSKNEKMNLIFEKGMITSIKMKDDESYFGVLLVETGFTSYDEVKKALSLDTHKPIGERLVEINSLSPHAINIIRQKQMVIRLSKTIYDDSLQINFSQKDEEPTLVNVDTREMMSLSNDWVETKISFEWLQSLYVPLMEAPFKLAENSSQMNSIKNQPLLLQVPNILNHIKGTNLNELMGMDIGTEEDILKAIHLLAVNRIISLSESNTSTSNFEKRMERLEKIFGDIDEKNHFEVLGLSTRARASEINRAYHEFAKALHPDKLPPDAPSELRDLTETVFSKINEAHKALSNDKKRQEYLKILEHGELEDALDAENLFEVAKKMLSRGQYEKALNLLTELNTKKGRASDIIVYLIWAKLKVGYSGIEPNEFILSIKKLMGKVPHEERHNHVYFYVRGLYYKSAKNYEKAIKYFKHASSIDPQFIEAKRELVRIKSAGRSSSKKRSVTATGELSTVITKFFKKKSG